MKRRMFLRSMWMKGIALPSAYLLTPKTGHAAPEILTSKAENTRHGCGRTDTGESIRKHGVIARDFYDPHLELIRLLKEASEIEHSLMIQYLFAAYTTKPRFQAIVGPAVPSSDGLLGIAIQEMQHLAVVNKLLVALGSSPNLETQDFPYEIDIYPFPITLERLSRDSLARYTYVEAGRKSMPADEEKDLDNQLLCDELTAVLGSDTGMNRVAGLYEIVVSHLESMRAEGRLELDNYDDWIAQLYYIMDEGETAHFRFFSRLFLGDHPAFANMENPWDLPQDHPDFPSFDIEANPTAYFGHENQIKSPEARAFGWLANLHYWIVLMMLDLHYRVDSEPLNALAQTHMVGPLQSLAGRLAEYGAGLPFDRLSLGYSPAADHAGNLRLLKRLSWEADTLAKKMAAGMPAGYPLELHRATTAIIDAELKRFE